MSNPVTIVTGASRGLGLAIAAQLLQQGHRVLSIARGTPALEHERLIAWHADLAEPEIAAGRLTQWLEAMAPASVPAINLINNAGVVSRLAPLADIDAADLSNALRVGLEAPLVLTAAFLRATRGWAAPRKVLLISSGLGRRAMAGSASYCAAKAGMDHLARAIALEQAAEPNGARVCALAPGVIDTDMQIQLRAGDPALFPERARFVGLKDDGLLDSPSAAAAKVIAFLHKPGFGDEPVADVRGA
jgi:benzil reductase ((S)-benzoin forming)